MNRLITVYISFDDIPKDLVPSTSFTIKDFLKQIKNNKNIIHTTQTSAISSYYYTYQNNGWDIKVIHKGKEILFSKLLADYEGSKSYGREIRLSQNWEKMFYSGCFDVNLEN